MEDYLTRKLKYTKIAKELIGRTASELVKVMIRNEHPDLYFSLEEELIDALNKVYIDGLIAGKREVSKAIMDFDKSEDKVDN
jgi:hypothetical protein